MMKESARNTPQLITVATWFCGVLILTTFVSLTIASSWGPIWHLFNADTFTFQEWRVPIPNRFYLKHEGDVPTLWKLGFGRPVWEAPLGQISLFNFPDGRRFRFSQDFDRFVSESSAIAREAEFRFLSEKRITVAGRPGYCLQFASRFQESETEAKCVIEDSSVSLWYWGDFRYLDDFWAVLQGMTFAQEYP